MAESPNYAGMLPQAVIASSSSGGTISISFNSDSVQMTGSQYIHINRAKLREIYSSNKTFTQSIDGVVLKVLGGVRNDQEVKNISPGYLHVLVQCYTDERFIEVLADYDSGKMQNHLQDEFVKIGLDVQEPKIKIDNLKEVNVQRAKILNRY